MIRGTMAERRYRLLEPDRAAQYDAIREQMRERGQPERVRDLDEFMAGWQQTEGAELYGDPLSAVLALGADAVEAALIDLGADQARVSTAWVGATKREDVSAQMVPFADGSGLVMISDAIVSLAHLYSQYAGQAFNQLASGGVGRLWRTFQAPGGAASATRRC